MIQRYTLIFLFLFSSFAAIAQGTETFQNIPALNPTSSYGAFNWTGDNGLTWSATDTRTDLTITGKAPVIRNGSIVCNNIPNGIGEISFKNQQFYSGSGGKLDVYVNDILVGSANPTTTLATATISNINVSGTFKLEIKQSKTGLRIGIDDLSWTGYNAIPCTEPTSAATGLTFSTTTSSITGTFTVASPAADGYLIVRSTTSTPDAFPVDGTNYSEGATIGSGTVVTTVTAGNFTDDNLPANTTYYYFIYSLNDQACGGGPNYLTTTYLSGSTSTQPLGVCVAPTTTATSIVLTPAATSISGSFTVAGDADTYLVVVSTSSTLSETPVNGTLYTTGQSFGGGSVVKFSGTNYFTATGLSGNTTYYFFIFSANNYCTGTPPLYNTIPATAFTQTTAISGIPAGYYDGTDGLTCGALKTKLRDIISTGYVQLTYTPGIWQAFQYTDIHRNDDNTADIIWDMYSDNPSGPEPYTYTYQVDQCGGSGYSGEGDCYNREHSTPKSWFNDQEPMYTDIQHLFPTDGYVNNMRNNYPYGEVTTITEESDNHSKLGTGNNFGYTGIVFEPIDAYKGDFARASLYMATRYENEIISQNWSANLNANDLFLSATDQPDPDKRKLQIYDDWYIKLLFKWIAEDPVSQKEINRNDAIYYLTGQHNRNPYIDHPEYAAVVWECTGLLPVTVYDFKAIRQDNNILLQWDATFETKFSHFEILRSEDGNNFYKIGTVKGSNLSRYYFTDNQLPEGNVAYYRLNMIDIDGKSQLSKVVTVRLNNNFSNAIVYPNPVSGVLKIKVDRTIAANSKMQIMDMTGRIMKTETIRNSGNVIQENVSSLMQGRYFVKIFNGDEVINCSFVIIR